MERPRTGRDLARLRLTLGLSLSQVAAAMGTTHHTIQRWHAALATLAARRSATLAEQGFRPRDLPQSLRREIARLANT
jgi:transcriptional regulator with XRE-family HTH domain